MNKPTKPRKRKGKPVSRRFTYLDTTETGDDVDRCGRREKQRKELAESSWSKLLADTPEKGCAQEAHAVVSSLLGELVSGIMLTEPSDGEVMFEERRTLNLNVSDTIGQDLTDIASSTLLGPRRPLPHCDTSPIAGKVRSSPSSSDQD